MVRLIACMEDMFNDRDIAAAPSVETWGTGVKQGVSGTAANPQLSACRHEALLPVSEAL